MITVKIEGFDELAGKLESLSDAVGESALRSAVNAGATVLKDEVLLRVPVGPDRVIKGKLRPGGTLKANIYQKHIDEQSSESVQTYFVGVRVTKAPHWHFAEFGTVKEAAHPYLRPSFEAQGQSALTAVRNRLAQRVQEAIGAMSA